MEFSIGYNFAQSLLKPSVRELLLINENTRQLLEEFEAKHNLEDYEWNLVSDRIPMSLSRCAVSGEADNCFRLVAMPPGSWMKI